MTFNLSTALGYMGFAAMLLCGIGAIVSFCISFWGDEQSLRDRAAHLLWVLLIGCFIGAFLFGALAPTSNPLEAPAV